MKQLTISLLIWISMIGICHAGEFDFKTGSDYFTVAENLLGHVKTFLKPNETTLQELLPQCWVESPGQMKWETAVEYADKHYNNQPAKRALMLWKTLYPQQPATELDKLQAKRIEWIPGGHHYQKLNLVILENIQTHLKNDQKLYVSKVSISTYIQGKTRINDSSSPHKHLELKSSVIVGPTRLALHNVMLRNIRFTELVFNFYGKLHHFTMDRTLPGSHTEAGSIRMKGDMIRRKSNARFLITESDQNSKPVKKKEYNKDLIQISNQMEGSEPNHE